jgi:hypothetical protein
MKMPHAFAFGFPPQTSCCARSLNATQNQVQALTSAAVQQA